MSYIVPQNVVHFFIVIARLYFHGSFPLNLLIFLNVIVPVLFKVLLMHSLHVAIVLRSQLRTNQKTHVPSVILSLFRSVYTTLFRMSSDAPTPTPCLSQTAYSRQEACRKGGAAAPRNYVFFEKFSGSVFRIRIRVQTGKYRRQ